MVGACIHVHDSYVHMLPKNPNFNYLIGPTSNGYNILNISPN